MWTNHHQVTYECMKASGESLENIALTLGVDCDFIMSNTTPKPVRYKYCIGCDPSRIKRGMRRNMSLEDMIKNTYIPMSAAKKCWDDILFKKWIPEEYYHMYEYILEFNPTIEEACDKFDCGVVELEYRVSEHIRTLKWMTYDPSKITRKDFNYLMYNRTSIICWRKKNLTVETIEYDSLYNMINGAQVIV